MKYFLLSVFFLSIQLCNGQTALVNLDTGCKFTLPWSADNCTFNWTGDCIDSLPEGKGVLTVWREGNEIMRYEGEMKGGNFNGQGFYQDGINRFEGLFQNGRFIPTNQLQEKSKSRIDTTAFNKSAGWELKQTVTKQIDNFYFTFPNKGYAYENRDKLVEQCTQAFQENCALIHDDSYTEFTHITFLQSKNDMLLHAGIYVKGGAANVYNRSIHMMVADENEGPDKQLNPPIKHEVMHMVAMTAWGNTQSNMNWLNEGLATYAQNDCSGYTVAEIYRLFLEEGMLVSIEDLTSDFYHIDEMIGYHQSAYIAEFMLSNYGIEKLEAVWKGGFSQFEAVYGFSFSQMEEKLNQHVMKLHPIAPEIDWSVLKKGCE